LTYILQFTEGKKKDKKNQRGIFQRGGMELYKKHVSPSILTLEAVFSSLLADFNSIASFLCVGHSNVEKNQLGPI